MPAQLDSLIPLYRRGGVRLVLSGHEHNFQHGRMDGIDHVVSGAGAKLDADRPSRWAETGLLTWAAATSLPAGRGQRRPPCDHSVRGARRRRRRAAAHRALRPRRHGHAGTRSCSSRPRFPGPGPAKGADRRAPMARPPASGGGHADDHHVAPRLVVDWAGDPAGGVAVRRAERAEQPGAASASSPAGDGVRGRSPRGISVRRGERAGRPAARAPARPTVMGSGARPGEGRGGSATGWGRGARPPIRER